MHRQSIEDSRRGLVMRVRGEPTQRPDYSLNRWGADCSLTIERTIERPKLMLITPFP
jgi:hypothetical protein